MRAVLETRNRRLERRLEAAVHKRRAQQQGEQAKQRFLEDATLGEARDHLAACRIQAIIRRFLACAFVEALRGEIKAAVHIQRVIRGFIARRLATQERWKRLSTVPSMYALKLLLNRSRTIRRIKDWEELYDTHTQSFWYYDTVRHHNVWDPPAMFQGQFVCPWQGWNHPYRGDLDEPCRKAFANRQAYENHLSTAHRWMCAACDHLNAGLTFPKCSLCGNTRSREAEDMVSVFRKHVRHLDDRLGAFVTLDTKSRNPGYQLALELSLTTQAVHQRQQMQRMGDEELLSGRSQASTAGCEGGTNSARQDQAIVSSLLTNADYIDSDQLDPQEQADLLLEAPAKVLFQLNESSLASELFFPQIAVEIDDNNLVTTYLDNDSLFAENFESTKSAIRTQQEDMDATDEKRDESETIFTPDACATDQVLEIVHGQYQRELEQRRKARAARGSMEDSISQATVTSWATTEVTTLSKHHVAVCIEFLKGTCPKLDCARAHPGIRDSATIDLIRNEVGARVPFTRVCQTELFGCCEHGKKCTLYHVYKRPSTAEIIAKLYPPKEGVQSRLYASGARFQGHVKNRKFSGYGILSYSNGDVFMGDWANGQRNGPGIFRSSGGREFIGMWKDNVRHGWGCLSFPNGDRFEGEFADGRPHGVGRLMNASGDVYSGEFANGRYNGIGTMTRHDGEVYVGCVKGGEAHGLGVLALRTGEKYKGQFVSNHRHGKGACLFPSNAKYYGSWEKGVPHGVGAWLSPDEKERYIGHWAFGRRHGEGRYYYRNGDVFDGHFVNDIAQGFGVYVHVRSGNMYMGEWLANKRAGKGKYIFRSGSHYEGSFADNHIHGTGVFTFVNGCKYVGQFERNRRHGKGKFQWPNGNIYIGQFEGSRMCGFGTMKYASGHSYAGTWKDNKKHGKGVFQFADGNVYEGEFHCDSMHGQGKLVFYPGTILEEWYEGQWVHGKRNGQGVYKYNASEGTMYEGQWVDNIRHGLGTMHFKDGSVFRGEFMYEKMTGYGTYMWPNGSQYEGDWRDNERHGWGSLIAADGTIYVGEFRRSKKCGKGRMQYLDGSCYEGTWDNDEIKGRGRYSIQVPSSDAEAATKTVKLKVFGY